MEAVGDSSRQQQSYNKQQIFAATKQRQRHTFCVAAANLSGQGLWGYWKLKKEKGEGSWIQCVCWGPRQQARQQESKIRKRWPANGATKGKCNSSKIDCGSSSG